MVEPCYKAPFRSQINISWGFFSSFGREVEVEEIREDLNWEKGGLLGGREAVTGFHVVGAVTIPSACLAHLQVLQARNKQVQVAKSPFTQDLNNMEGFRAGVESCCRKQTGQQPNPGRALGTSSFTEIPSGDFNAGELPCLGNAIPGISLLPRVTSTVGKKTTKSTSNYLYRRRWSSGKAQAGIWNLT
ncbi:hypothetical protein EK904_001513 [Melospiza melodia maxima]|nr:hypothetical protein EK904_001513 [Melospiza melodia maxima]